MHPFPPLSPASDLGIVVVSYNTRQLTCDCLDSVYRALVGDEVRFHVWVVDNASSDGSSALVRERFPQATLITSAENLGFARASNLAIEQMALLDSPPRYLFLLNPDTVVQADAIALLLAFMDATPRAGVAGARLLYGDGSFQHGAFHFPTLFMALFDFWPINHRLIDSTLNGRYPRRLYDAGAPFSIDHPLGAAMMVRWETIGEVGPLDSGYFMYCEEVDWCLRIKRAGWGIFCVPHATILHLAGQSARQFRDAMFVALWRSRYRLFAKHYGRLYQALARIIVRAGLRRDMRRVAADLRRGALSPDEAQRRLAAFQQVLEM